MFLYYNCPMTIVGNADRKGDRVRRGRTCIQITSSLAKEEEEVRTVIGTSGLGKKRTMVVGEEAEREEEEKDKIIKRRTSLFGMRNTVKQGCSITGPDDTLTIEPTIDGIDNNRSTRE
jgi:hypothetical protein